MTEAFCKDLNDMSDSVNYQEQFPFHVLQDCK